MTNTTTDVDIFLSKTYDIIIVGGGTAGLALASRLSETPLRIGVLEAGLDNISSDPTLHVAGGWPLTATDPKYHWGFSSTPQNSLLDETHGNPGRVLNLPRHVHRASKAEYDALESVFGNQGWNFDSLLPYFRKTQSHTAQPSELFPESKVIPSVHGTEGPIHTSQNWWASSLIDPFVKTALSQSFQINPNPDNGNPLGVINVSRAVHPKTSRRQDATETYLKRIEGRDNITVLLGAQARQIIFAESNEFLATGVEFQIGAYQSPQLLELSGIGLRNVLERYNIETKVELPVGENLQDHMLLFINKNLKTESELKATGLLPAGLSVQYIGNGQENDPARSAQASVTGHPFLNSHLQSLKLGNPSHEKQIEELAALLDKQANESQKSMERAQLKLQKHWLNNPSENVPEACLMFACLPGMAGIPTPEGGMTTWFPISHFHIGSSDPLVAPLIDNNCLNEYDIRAFLLMIRFVDELLRREPFGALLVQEPPRSDEELIRHIRTTSQVIFHPISTTPMASRELGGVVDSNLIVYGTRNLRVVDAGIFPIQLSAALQASIYAVAEKAADIIKTHHGF
ncbi:hypothetical protein Clacol_006977 [Clathrus columnatus]|uniref:Glucose-methanol-choline oxidoreductase N-terminal domain-containing protein n=1 Tax=Clathrus columnatus TaxID=1419009 RepID=A0AAV5AJ91_9AGAM|nr:hypothetical protein Clacol_006977 [Clathrus columnatus]